MLINRLAKEICAAPELRHVLEARAQNADADLSLIPSARPLIISSIMAAHPCPTLVLVPTEDEAYRMERALTPLLGQEVLCRFPERKDYPWSEKSPDDAAIATRSRSLERLCNSEVCLCVASASAFLRCVPPPQDQNPYYASTVFSAGDEISPKDATHLLLTMGYHSAPRADAPGTFYLHGDALDIHPASMTCAVRIEFFGDEIDTIRMLIASSGQCLGKLNSLRISPSREMTLTDDTVERAEHALYDRAQINDKAARVLELIRQKSTDPSLEQYLPVLYGMTFSPLAHLPHNTAFICVEPRALFDACLRSWTEIKAAAEKAGADPEGLYIDPRRLDFASFPCLSLQTMHPDTVRPSNARFSHTALSSELFAVRPDFAGSEEKLFLRIKGLLAGKNRVVCTIPERRAREAFKLELTDKNISFTETLETAPENSSALTDPIDTQTPLIENVVNITDIPIISGLEIPSAALAVFCLNDLETGRPARSRKTAHGHTRSLAKKTELSFPFKPGDYVVHSVHGIAHFAGIVRRQVTDTAQDYFLLEYAEGDKLYVPLELLDRITRYIGPDGASPRLTRLHTADWSRALSRARKSAEKLGFDLVDLYSRRSVVKGYAFPPDTPEQEEMEASVGFELTQDQIYALQDIKADMEAPRPMDRLLCGDVGFGKTEVALCAAFKCATNSKQVMVLCPTTILAQQHFETFFARCNPFGVKVELVSRFVAPGTQRRILHDFADGATDILIGTHRLLSADVIPHDLGLVIIDEEQRFGVRHKEQIKNIREQIDVLSLSATPIPRTMQMALSGVRDMSLIMTPPPGRKEVKVWVGTLNPDVISSAIRTELARGGQVYYVSNRIRNIEDALLRVREAAPEARCGIVHGQMSAAKIENVMLDFTEGEIDVLIATTIIENGIDNPHTNTLIIEDSERLGLSQLYQLKGRVGRGRTQAYAYFMFPAESMLTPEATQRLQAIFEYRELGSGTKIAMRDLEIRGAGSLIGADQHGNLSGVGFELFMQMLQDAVTQAMGSQTEPEPPDIIINLPADVYLSEEYLEDVDARVKMYRMLAAAETLSDIDLLENDCERRYGALPEAGKNLFEKARIRLRATRLDISSITLSNGRITFLGARVAPEKAAELKREGAVVFPQSKKITQAWRRRDGALLPNVNKLLSRIGGDDETD